MQSYKDTTKLVPGPSGNTESEEEKRAGFSQILPELHTESEEEKRADFSQIPPELQKATGKRFSEKKSRLVAYPLLLIVVGIYVFFFAIELEAMTVEPWAAFLLCAQFLYHLRTYMHPSQEAKTVVIAFYIIAIGTAAVAVKAGLTKNASSLNQNVDGNSSKGPMKQESGH